MRLSLRIATAAVLIIITLALFNHNFQSKSHSPKSIWRFDTTSFHASLRQQQPSQRHGSSPRKWGIGTSARASSNYLTTQIEVPFEGIIVIGKLQAEDTAWVSAELTEWRNFIYTVDDVNAPNHTPVNKGREALPYLQYIVDHYHDLPALMLFLHSHRDGWPAAWHTDTMDYNNVDSVRALQRQWVLDQGFVNLRCQTSPGCPAEMQPFRNPPKPGNTGEKHYADAWEQLFGNTDVPEIIGAPCCSQFAVSREAVLKRPLTDYQRMYNWVLNNDLPDEVTSNIMEYSWHIIFGKEPVFCPDVFQCYADVYGEEVVM